MDDAVERLAARLFHPERNKLENACRRYPDKTEFVEWMNKQNEKGEPRRVACIIDAFKTLGKEVDVDSVCDAYLAEERKQMLAFFNGDETDIKKLKAAILEAV